MNGLQGDIPVVNERPSAPKRRKMEGRKWEDLTTDCLVNIFGRVGVESLILDVPFVCKSWHEATLSTLCWQRLVFPKISRDRWWEDDPFKSRLMDEYRGGGRGYFSVTAFIKFVIDRSCGSVTMIVLPSSCTEEALLYVADKCLSLKILALPYNLPNDHLLKIPNLISKWKNLQLLRLGSSFNMREILTQINIHCNNFAAFGVTQAYIGEDEASAIATLLPNIKYLDLRRASIERDNLVTILQGCKQLVYFDVSGSIGFEGDDEISKLASHISTFKYEGSRAKETWDDYDDEPVNYPNDDGNLSD